MNPLRIRTHRRHTRHLVQAGFGLVAHGRHSNNSRSSSLRCFGRKPNCFLLLLGCQNCPHLWPHVRWTLGIRAVCSRDSAVLVLVALRDPRLVEGCLVDELSRLVGWQWLLVREQLRDNRWYPVLYHSFHQLLVVCLLRKILFCDRCSFGLQHFRFWYRWFWRHQVSLGFHRKHREIWWSTFLEHFSASPGADSSAIFVVAHCLEIKDYEVLAPHAAGVHEVADNHALLAAWSELVAGSVGLIHRGLVGNFGTKSQKRSVEGFSEALLVGRTPPVRVSCDVVQEAEVTHSSRPPPMGRACLLHHCSSTFHGFSN